MAALRTGRFPHGNPAREHRPVHPALFASRIESSIHSVSNHPTSSPEHQSGFGPEPTAQHRLPTVCIPRDSCVFWASPLASRLATMSGRIEFVIILRTGCSPLVALHPASRRRSYVRIQSSDPTLTRTFTSPIQSTPQTHQQPLVRGLYCRAWRLESLGRCHVRCVAPSDSLLWRFRGRRLAIGYCHPCDHAKLYSGVVASGIPGV